MNKNQILLEINAAIAAMLDSNWSYFSAPSYMKGFFADGIIRCLLYDDFLRTHIPHACLWRIYMGFFVRIYMRVCKKMVVYLGIKTLQSRKERKYTWQYCLIVSLNCRCWRFVWKEYLLWVHWENCPDAFWHGQQMHVGGCGATVEVVGYTASVPQWSSTATRHCEHPWKACIALVSKEVVLDDLFCLSMSLLVLIASSNWSLG